MRHRPYILSFIFLLTVLGCADDSLLSEENGKVPNEGMPFTLTFTTSVPAMDDEAPHTRAIYYGNPTYYEDWVDTQDGIRVLFFITKREKTGASYVAGKYEDTNLRVASDPQNPLKDYFLFESTSRWVTQLPYDEDNTLRYRVTVPVYQIGDKDSEYSEYWNKIREYLRTYDFKIAILANHPSNTFTWGFKNSVLNAPDIDDLSTAKDVKTIHDIHHSVADNTYANNTNGNRKDAYEMFVDNKNKIDGIGTMGPFTSWVINRSKLYGDALGGVFSTKETALTWIRDYWIPDLIYNEDSDPDIDYQTLYHNYRHIWSYWNFGGAAEDNALPYSTKSTMNPHINEWEVRNGALLRDWVIKAVDNGGKFLNDLSTASTGTDKYDGSMPLTFHPSSATAVITSGSNGKRFYGVKLPAISSAPSSASAKDCFHFEIRGSGSVIVRHSGGTITVKGGTSPSTTRTTKTINGVSVTEVAYSFDNNNKPIDGFVYSSSGNPIVYDIEYAQDRYVYLTDREGVLPSADNPIPMYGVQKFKALEGWWDEGASFDLTTGGQDTNGNRYEPKTIALLRAVAKIEVLIPKSLGVPKHVYLHSLNASVRCEPMDVATPTNELWKEHNSGCEWELVQAHGTFIKDDGKYDTNDYKTKLAWYYGNWLEWGWNFNNLQWKPNYENGPFPRVFNPYISRADCAAFIDVTDYYNDQYYHYLFYMGENTIDASSQYNGASSGGAMIPHIELRFDERYAATCKVVPNTDLNLMDMDCYHIYFTEGGIASGARNSDGTSKIANGKYESEYETKTQYLKEHWPIMRNHIYRFTLLDNGASNMNGIVVDAQNRSVDFDFK